ncbi:DEAD/DEAH box helicase [Mucilaginibacter sp. SP1R1]|uniref:DEAD/DEAH box helicase n=1 Tax=Mucilaginibacter sp. SP1R1 TaxID=2723091 RepID=UPI00161BE3BA|nr:DEAD/DEAH box helicase family protein [Mucilaginibacter sp. SP1R1]MBB6149449.1 superfamily II DNA or RNA helicase [Mucilaginibacter sp. SP1R1]
MKKTPRQYQIDIVDRTSRSLAKNKAVILHAPTGAGKSLMIDMIVTRCIEKGKTVLVLSDARKIYNQLVKECNGTEINANVKSMMVFPGQCYVGMIQTLIKRPMIIAQLQELGSNLILLIDECHISTSTKLIDYLPDAYRIGCTATPYGVLHKHLPTYYNDLVEGPQVDWLIQQGYLTNYRHKSRVPADTSLLEIRNGEVTERSNEIVFGAQRVYDGLFEDLKEFAYKKCVIFVASIKQAEALNEKLNEAGFGSTRYHSQVEHGEYELAKFTSLGMANILVTIKSLSKGWDYPPIDMVVLMHKTLSTSVYQQEIGRGSRIYPGKDMFTVLDYGMNWKQHGLYFEDRPYSELWKKVKRKGEAEGPSACKSCVSCESIIPVSARICKYCGYEYPVPEQVFAQGELVDLTDEYHDLVGKKISELTPLELANYAKLKNKRPFAIRVAKAREQIAQGFLMDFAANMGYKRGWLDHQVIPNEPIEFTDIVLR